MFASDGQPNFVEAMVTLNIISQQAGLQNYVWTVFFMPLDLFETNYKPNYGNPY